MYNLCRGAVWSIVDKISSGNAVPEDILSSNCEGLAEFDLPIEFGSSRKRKRSSKESSIPKEREMPRNMVVPHENIALWNGRRVMILGVGPSLPAGSFAIVRELSSAVAFEVSRNKLRQIPIEDKEDCYIAWEKDFYYHMSLNKPEDIHEKYWDQRYRMFNRFDKGIQLDPESWYSVTYEIIGNDIASRCSSAFHSMNESLSLVFDCFSGCGGCSIPFAKLPQTHVFALDMDAKKLQMLR